MRFKIWEKYFFFETLKALLFVLLAFSALYVLVDYVSHTGNFHHHQTRLSAYELVLFYTGELVRRSEVLLPFAILVATIRVITRLNVRNELVAMLAAGISMRKLLRPFIVIGLIGTLFLYLSEEIFVPYTMEISRTIGEKSSVEKALIAEMPAAQHLRLEDGSLLLFQRYDRAKEQFFDAWWVKSIDELWRLKTLDVQSPQRAQEVEKFLRNQDGALVSMGREVQKELSEIKFNRKRLLETLTPPEDLSLSELTKKASTEVSSEKEAKIKTALYRKLILPWLALLVVLGPIPLCIVFSRQLNTFFIYTVSFFGLVFVYILLNSATTLSNRQVISPEYALFLPFAIIGLILVGRWTQIK